MTSSSGWDSYRLIQTEDKPVFMKVGERKNVYDSNPPGGDNTHQSRQFSKFFPNESLSAVLVLSNDVVIRFSRSFVDLGDASISSDKICVVANVSVRDEPSERRNTSDLNTAVTLKAGKHCLETIPQSLGSSCTSGTRIHVPYVPSTFKEDEVNEIVDASKRAGMDFCESVSTAFSNTAAYLSTSSKTNVVKPAELEIRSRISSVGENTLTSAPWQYTWDADPQEYSETDDCEDVKDTSLKPVTVNRVSQAHTWYQFKRRRNIFKMKQVRRKHICSDCELVFPLQRLYLRHKEEERTNKLKCELCQKMCVSQCLLKQHYQGHCKEQGNNVLCLLCQLCFSSRMVFLRHKCQRRYMCRICCEDFTSRTIMNRHMEVAHEEVCKCYTCGKVFSCKTNLHRHLKGCARLVQALKVADGVYQCQVCGRTYQSISLFVNHRKIMTSGNSVKCRVCAQTFSSHCQLLQHVGERGVNIRDRTCRHQTQLQRPQHSLPDIAFKCESCDLQFHSKCGLGTHTTLRNCSKGDGKDLRKKIEPYFCKNCNKVYSTKTSIFRHKVSKKGCRYYSCSTCFKHFSSKKMLESHRMTHLEQTQDGGYHCSVCDKTYSRRTSYLKHKRRAQCDLTHFLKCQLCFKVFASVKSLNTHHKVSHPNGVNFCCHICERYFSSSKALVKHEALRRCTKPRVLGASVEGTQSMQCETCGKIYSNQSNLNRHRLKHTGERPYSCSQCGLKFADKSILKNHVQNIHVGTRPFLCQVCGKRFKTRTHVERHTRGHTDFRLPCTLCNKRYKHAQDLHKHQKKVHDSSMQSPT
ncbi:zinc finger protein 345-like [Haliotis rubra]|uniref:zinc finger protein 345-like n=1 Tax=Haliotis rubra TaxID=36100 RepID=UPI001EE5CA1A|nr:zinc finger protein 345-like [Haliotis rubra]